MNITRRSLLLTSAAFLAMGAPALAQQNVLRVGLIPSEDSRAMLAASDQLLNALEKNLGMKVQGFVASDYNGVIEALRSGQSMSLISGRSPMSSARRSRRSRRSLRLRPPRPERPTTTARSSP